MLGAGAERAPGGLRACLGPCPPLQQPRGAELLPGMEVAGMQLAPSPPPVGGVVAPPALLEPGSPGVQQGQASGLSLVCKSLPGRS